MSTRADATPGAMTGTPDTAATPARLRNLPSRLLSLTAMHADRLVTDGLGRADARKVVGGRGAGSTSIAGPRFDGACYAAVPPRFQPRPPSP